MKLYLIIAAVLSCSAVLAQDVISTDRPTQTAATSLVPSGHFQMESGYLYINVDGGFISHSLNSLLRFGVSPRIELRAFVDHSWNRISLDGAERTANLWAPLQLGAKIRISENEGWIPAASFVGMILLRSGEGRLEIDRSVPDLRVAFSNDLPGIFDLFYSLGITWIGKDYTPLELYTVGVGITISPTVWGYVEFFGFFDSSPISPSLDTGLTWRVTDNVQLDLTGGFDFPKAGGFFLSSGFNFRL
jgi:hypothetical protein